MTDEQDIMTGPPLVRWRAAANICDLPIQALRDTIRRLPSTTDTPEWMQGGLTDHDSMVMERRVFTLALGTHLETRDAQLMILQQGTRPLMSRHLMPRTRCLNITGKRPPITPGTVGNSIIEITWKPVFENVILIASSRKPGSKPTLTVVIWSQTA